MHLSPLDRSVQETMKNDYEIYPVDYQLCQFFSVLTIRFLYNGVPLHVVHDYVINTS